MILIAKRDDEVSDNGNQYVGNQRRQTHLWLTDTPILLRRPHGDPVRKRTVGSQTDHCTNKTGKVGESNRLAGPVIRGSAKGLSLGEIGCEETTCTPGDHKGSIFHNWESEEAPRDPESEGQGLDPVRVGLIDVKLAFGR